MTQEEIYARAIGQIQERRRNAERTQETRTVQIHSEIPETAEQERIAAIERHCKEADAMLRQLLTANGYPADYLDLHYTCPLCDDTGFVNGKPCKCLKQEIGRIGAEALNAHSQL